MTAPAPPYICTTPMHRFKGDSSMKTQLKFAAVSAIAALTLTACAAPASEPGEDGEERYEFTMGMASEDIYTAEWWGWLAADTLGYYDELGLDVEFVGTGGSGDAIEQVSAGNLDAGHPSAPAFGEAALVGLEVVNVFTYSSGAIFGIFAP